MKTTYKWRHAKVAKLTAVTWCPKCNQILGLTCWINDEGKTASPVKCDRCDFNDMMQLLDWGNSKI
jgi:transcription elongation factor Elf1